MFKPTSSPKQGVAFMCPIRRTVRLEWLMIAAGLLGCPNVHGAEYSAEELFKLSHPEAVTCIAFSPDGKILASACSDGKIRLWDTKTGKEQSTIDNKGYVTSHMAFIDAKTLLGSSELSKKNAKPQRCLQFFDLEAKNVAVVWIIRLPTK